MSQQNQTRFVATCPACDERKETDTANEIVAFYRRHHSLTGHDIEWEHADLGVDAVPDVGLASVIGELNAHYENGVPLGIVSAAMSVQGRTIGETMAAVHEERMTGRLWEPRTDHFSAY